MHFTHVEMKSQTYFPSETKAKIFLQVLKQNKYYIVLQFCHKQFYMNHESPVLYGCVHSLLKPLVESQCHIILLLQSRQCWIYLGADCIHVHIQLPHQCHKLLNTTKVRMNLGERSLQGYGNTSWSTVAWWVLTSDWLLSEPELRWNRRHPCLSQSQTGKHPKAFSDCPEIKCIKKNVKPIQ